MKINEKILSLPPYISTAWSNISTVRLKENQLCITLTDGTLIQIPSLPGETIEIIFKTHAEHLENLSQKSSVQSPTLHGLNPESAIQIGFGSMEGASSAIMQHDPSMSDSPPIPDEVIEKITAITRILAPEDFKQLTPSVANCNCFHCQLVRTIEQSKPNDPIEEIVVDRDLEFRQWDILSKGEQLYTVTSCLDKNESYTVYLGDPIGCTCGHSNCEHIVAVLKS